MSRARGHRSRNGQRAAAYAHAQTLGTARTDNGLVAYVSAADPVRAVLGTRRALLADVDLREGAPERLLACCDVSGTVQLYEVVSGGLVELTSLPEPVASAHYLPGGRRAVLATPAIWIPALVVGHFGTDPPLLLDPFAGGGRVQTEAPQELVRPWRANEVAMRMLNNLVLAYQRRGDIGDAIHAARLRLTLPTEASHRDILQAQLRTMQARLN